MIAYSGLGFPGSNQCLKRPPLLYLQGNSRRVGNELHPSYAS